MSISRRKGVVVLSAGLALVGSPFCSASRPSGVELFDEVIDGMSAAEVDRERDSDVEAMSVDLSEAMEVSLRIRQAMLNEPLMCGDTTIRSILKVKDGFDVERVKNIRFDDAIDQANQYILYQNGELSKTVDKVKELNSRLFHSRTVENQEKPDLDEPLVTSAIEEAIKAGFGSIEAAKASDCLEAAKADTKHTARTGSDASGLTAPKTTLGGPDPYQVSQQAFRDLLTELLKDKQHKVGPQVESTCSARIVSALHGEGYCFQLCKSMVGIAAAFYTGEHKEAGENSGAIQQQISDLQDVINKLQQEIKECETTREGIMHYKGQLGKISSTYDMHGRLSRHTQAKLRSVSEIVKGFKEQLGIQEANLQELAPILEKAKDKHASVKKQMADTVRESQELSGLLNESYKNLEELQGMLEDSHTAVNSVADFRAGLVSTAHSVVQVYNDTVNKPLDEIGVFQAAEVLSDDKWPDASKLELPVWSRPRDTSKKLLQNCLDVAKSANDMCAHEGKVISTHPEYDVKEEVKELCTQGKNLQGACPAEADYVSDIKDIIVNKQATVKQVLHDILKEVDIPSSTGGTDSSGNGEPQFARQYKGVRALEQSKFLKDYVSMWSTEGTTSSSSHGLMLEMQKGLKSLADDLADKARSTTDKLKGLGEKLLKNVHVDMDLSKLFQEVSATLTVEERKKIGIDVKIEEFQSGIKRKEEDQAAFTEYRGELERHLNELQGDLQKAFHELRETSASNFGTVGADHESIIETQLSFEELQSLGHRGPRRFFPRRHQSGKLHMS